MNTMEAIYQRRSIRKFKPDPVSKELMEKLLDAATKAPSGMNRQPWRFIVLEGAKKEGLVEIYRKEISKWKKLSKRVGAAEVTGEIIRDAPVLILVFNTRNKAKGLIRFFSNVMDVMDIQSIGGSIQTMLLAAQEFGLGTLWIGNTFFAMKKISKYVNKNEELVAAVAVGYPDETPKPRPRKDWSEVTEWLI